MIVFIHHSVNPYRVAFFTALHKKKIPFIVYFLSMPAANRKWTKNDFVLSFPHRFLSGWKIKVPGNDHSYFQVNTDVIAALSQDKPTIIISIGWNYLATFLAAGFAQIKKIRFVIWSESTRFEPSAQRTLTKPLIWLLLKTTWMCVAAGSRSRQYLEDLGVNPAMIRLAYYTVDTRTLVKRAQALRKKRKQLRKKLGYADKQVVVLTVGQFIARKGVHTILQAASLLKSTSNIIFSFVGYGELLSTLEVAAQSNAAIQITQYIKPEHIMEQFVAADIFVLASLEETWGLVVNEALCASLPVLVSDRAGSSDDLVISGQNGFTFDPEQPKKLASLIRTLAKSESKRSKMGAVGFKHIQNFTIEQNCSIVSDLQRVSTKN